MAKTTRTDIVKVASDLFRDQGYDATSMADIAAKAGILKGSLYYYFPAKHEILREIVEPIVRSMLDRLTAIAARDASATERLQDAITAHVTRFDAPDHSDLFVYLQERLGRDHGQVAELSRQYQSLLEGLVREGIAAGEFTGDLDAKLVAFLILGACNWMHKWYQSASAVTSGTIAQTFGGIVLSGILVRQSSVIRDGSG